MTSNQSGATSNQCAATTPSRPGATPAESAATLNQAGVTLSQSGATTNESTTTPSRPAATPDEFGTTFNQSGVTPSHPGATSNESAAAPSRAPTTPHRPSAASNEPATTSDRHPATTSNRRPIALLLAVVLVAVQAIMIIAVAWPATRLGPREVPVAVVGPARATLALRAELAADRRFAVTTVADADAARTALLDRADYGAIVVTASGPTLLVATAASPTVASALEQLATTALGPSVKVVDVAPETASDPHGAGLSSVMLPIVLYGLIAGILLALFVPGTRGRLAGATLFAVGGGLAATGIMRDWLGAFDGSYVRDAGVFALGIGTICFAVMGLGALLGRAGFVLGAATMMMLGNPLSGMTSAPELLPRPWGAIGQLLPPGATGTALKSVAFFDGHGAAHSLIVLACWAIAGIALVGINTLRRTRSRQPASAPAPVAV
jgi:hypothetical protein